MDKISPILCRAFHKGALYHVQRSHVGQGAGTHARRARENPPRAPALVCGPLVATLSVKVERAVWPYEICSSEDTGAAMSARDTYSVSALARY